MALELEELVEVGGHAVQFYGRDQDLVDTVTGFVGSAIRSGDVAIVVATPAHRDAFETALAEQGFQIDEAIDNGTYVAVDAAAMLACFVSGGEVDARQFRDAVGGCVERAGQRGRAVRVYGEMVAVLWEAGHVSAAIELEALWNELGEELSFSLLCGYRQEHMEADGGNGFFEVCHLHTRVIPAGPPPASPAARAFEAAAESPRAARHFVADVIDRWGLRQLHDDAMLVVSELATNAVLHARSRFVVTVEATSDALTISVRDRDRTLPAERHYGTASTTGRGVSLIVAISTRWGAEAIHDGKIVWADLRI